MSENAPKNFWDEPDPPPAGAWAEKRRLAAVLRELVAITVTTDASEDELRAATQQAEALVAQLGAHPRRTFKQGFSQCKTLDDFRLFGDRLTLTGKSNPFAPPMVYSAVGETAIGEVTFGPAYEGLPGCVHGGLVAAAIDQVFGFLQVLRGVRSVTGILTVKYREPTPLETPLRVEAHAVRTEGKKSYIAATVRANGRITAEGEGVFVAVGADRIEGLLEAVQRPKD